MKQYTSCFVGIPLPEKFQEEFEILLNDIKKLYPNLETVYPKTPHITVYYLDKQSQHVFPEIAEIIRKQINLLKDVVLKVGGFDNFTKQDTREGILFLNVIYAPSLSNFNQELTKTLNRHYSADNNLPFHPHMTVARIPGLKSEQDLKENMSRLEQKIDKIHWEFPITEIVLYGVDSTKQPQHQEKLITIPVSNTNCY